VQHCTRRLDFLYALYENRAEFTNGFNLKSLVKCLYKPEYGDYLNEICNFWDTYWKIRKRIENLGKEYVESPNEAEQIFLTLERGFDENAFERVVMSLIVIAENRFSHV